MKRFLISSVKIRLLTEAGKASSPECKNRTCGILWSFISCAFLMHAFTGYSQDRLVKQYRPNFPFQHFEKEIREIETVKKSKEYQSFWSKAGADTMTYVSSVSKRTFLFCNRDSMQVVFSGSIYERAADTVYSLQDIFVFTSDFILLYPYCPQTIRPLMKNFSGEKFRDSILDLVFKDCKEQSVIFQPKKRKKYAVYYYPPDEKVGRYFLLFPNQKFNW